MSLAELLPRIETALNQFADAMWSTPLVVLLVGGGLFFAIYSRLQPYRHLGHSVAVLRGRYDDPNAPGQVSHSQALSTALAGTMGLGNISGVAIAIAAGGPGAIFWMWVTAVIGVATKFYTASLAVMFRGKDSLGETQGGPMYVIREALPKGFLPLAYLFCLAGMIGTLPVFQANQFIQLLRDAVAIPAGWATAESHIGFDFIASSCVALLTVVVIIGKIQRIGRLTVRLVPAMVVLYLLFTAVVLFQYIDQIPAMLALIVSDAFTGQAAAGGALGTVIMIGVRRGAFSNEAGIGTESMAHGAAKTDEPIREGVVAMIGPVVDTLVVCTCTALIILLTGVWQDPVAGAGVTMTATAIEKVFPGGGIYLLLVMVALLSFSTIVTYWFYGAKCLGFLIGAQRQHYYTPCYIFLIVLGAVVSLDVVNGLLVGVYAIMAIPTMISSFVLAPKVNAAAKDYFRRLKGGEFD
ncbi:amino acid carrier protein [uncultured Pseudoteredinibacter sp.]|uniref:alanine/glycine:cation symporter family protein n=1 Tax=uncultured Pseudoteredinibacter sp. TaxID=1641701 RepID=UPI00261A7489|nr:amino acid carrier protein [uncultured Pseudoteredinibacter sp.]